MQTVIQLVLGIAFAALICAHQIHNVRGFWVRSILSSMALGAIQFLVVRWAAKGDSAYLVFQAGCAAGAGLASFWASRLSSGPRRRVR